MFSILKRINDIKISEDNFKSIEWENNYFAETDKKAIHISECKPETFSEEDLVRYFEYIIRTQVDILSNRARQFIKQIIENHGNSRSN